MSVRILEDTTSSGTAKACLYDSVSDTAFGPVVYDGEGDTAHDLLLAFIQSFEEDARTLSSTELNTRYNEWIKRHQDGAGDVFLTEEEREGLNDG